MSDSPSHPRPLLLVVATVHLDSQWRWTIQDTIREYLPRTLEENFALFESHPSYQLSFEGAFRYMLVQEYYPAQFERLKRWVEAGRWHPVGAMLDAPDVNCVSPESLLRHILYGNGFFARELGRASRDLFLPDCFGFGQALPSIAAHCGLRSFSSSKLVKWRAPGSMPFEIGHWRGPDRAEIVAAIQTEGYGEEIDEDLVRSPEWMARLREAGPVRVGVRYVGTGDRGGSPDRRSLERLERAIADTGPIRVRCVASDTLCDELTDSEREQLPVHDGELLLPTHGTGCWTAQAALKRWNRKNEMLADAAERVALMADWLGAIDYPRERLEGAWTRFLWHQMHDDLTGTSIPEAYRFSWNDQAVAANLFAGVLADSVAAVSRELDTRSRGTPVVVFNPTARWRQDVVDLELDAGRLPEGPLRVVGPHGESACQMDLAADGRYRLLFMARVAPVSLSVFEIVSVDSSAPELNAGAPEATERSLENHRYRVEIDECGDVAGVFDKRLQRELLRAPIRLQLLRNRSMRWPAWEIRPETVLASTKPAVIGAPATFRLTESGPVRAAIEVNRTAHRSDFRQTVRLSAGEAGERLEIEMEIDWATRGRLLKASFPLTASDSEATYDLGLGTIRRGNNRREAYEVPAQQWAGITDAGREFGAAVLNDCKYGWDKPRDDELRLSLVHSPMTLRKYPHQRVQEHGSHRFTLALCGHSGSGETATVVGHAESLNQPLRGFFVDASPGRLGRSVSLLECDDRAVSVQALKKSERGDAWALRLREIAGETHDRVRVRPSVPAIGAHETNGCEEEPRALDVDDGSVVTALPPNGLKTLLVRVADPPEPIARQDMARLALPWDHRASSLHGGDERVDFDGWGHSLPGELLPERLTMGEVEFALGPRRAGEPNALQCSGQEIALPAGFDRLWLLATSAAAPVEVTFHVDDVPRNLRIGGWTGWLAERERAKRWLGLVPARPGSLDRSALAWLGTHRHRQRGDDIEDEPYVFCYLFRYSIGLPPGSSRLTLPANGQVRLFAATASAASARLDPGQPLYG